VKGWSTSGLLAETLAFMEKKNLSYALLDQRGDIDTYAEYVAWRES
jgi:hypothetical protein